MTNADQTDWRFAVLLVGLAALAVTLVLAASRLSDDLDVSHVAEPPPALATMTALDAAEARIDVLDARVVSLEADLARTGAILIGEIERLKSARESVVAAPAPGPMPRLRKRSVPDPPASSYITLR